MFPPFLFPFWTSGSKMLREHNKCVFIVAFIWSRFSMRYTETVCIFVSNGQPVMNHHFHLTSSARFMERLKMDYCTGINWLSSLTGQEVINDTSCNEYTVYFAIIFFNSSQSKLYDMDGWKHIPPSCPVPRFSLRFIIHFSPLAVY